jgi:hypothetical protein
MHNYIDLYRYLNDFLARYLMLNLRHTLGNDLQWCQVYHTYLASECSTDTVFINREHMDWGPAKQDSDLYKGFSVPTFTADVLSHNYHLHQDLGETTRDYHLHPFLHKGGIDSKPPPPPIAGHKHWCSNSDNSLLGPDSGEDELPGTGPTKSS